MTGPRPLGSDFYDALEFRSGVPGIAWPAVPDALGMTMLALQYQFEQSERWPAPDLRRFQFRQIEALLAHAAAEAPYWQETLPRCGFRTGAPLTPEIWRRIPVLTREQVQREGARMRARSVPQFHGAVREVATSGSTGTPVRALKSELCTLLFQATALRESLWHRRDLAGTAAVVRLAPGTPRSGKRLPNWNLATGAAFAGGPSVLFDALRPAAELARSLARLDPDYLLTYPSLLAELAREAERQNLRFPALAGISTFGEHLSDEVRAAATTRFGVAVADAYSTEEAGYLAIQCPDAPVYHVQSETALVEVLDERGAECGPGEVGRVVVTPLHNFAMPLVRYDLGDCAEVGGPCACGRGLPVLTRILGRVRNMILRPDGSRFWPQMNALFRETRLPIRQFQIVQRSVDRLEMRLAADRRFEPAEEEELRALIRRLCRADYEIAITYCDAIPRGPGGKFEDSVCEIGR